MAERRHHADVLIAGFILVGAIGLLAGIVNQLIDGPDYVKAITWFVAAFIAAQIARRVLPDLAIDEMAIAAAVTTAIIVGIIYHRDATALDVQALIPIGVGVAGVMIGAWTAKFREPAHPVLLVAGMGAAGFGAAVLLIGASMLVADEGSVQGVALLAGAFAGTTLTAMYTTARGAHGAIGVGLVFGFLIAVSADESRIVGAVIGALLGWVIGAAGGALGARIRRRRPAQTVPEVRVHS